ncbi:MAG TPA: efflux transporter outer membrane subunit [Ramlibacter sp.]|nr:efflux transporter outer membrane subunit [Ramlibacter sp.]
MSHHTRRLAPALSAALAAALLAGCASQAGIAPSSAKLRDASSLGVTAFEAAPAQASAQWWRELGDAQLDRLVDQAVQGNPSLAIARARLDRARAVLEVADAATLPQVNGSLDLTRQRYTAQGAVPPPLAGAIRESGTLQLSASWEIDFFGKYQAALDAALGAARAAQADADAARVLLAGNVVRAYVQAARVEAQLAVAQRALAQREQALRLVQDRVNAGLDSRLELRQSESAVPEARQQIEALREQSALARNALAALVGVPGADPLTFAPSMAALKPLAAPTAIPADLLGRRADIAAARWRVEAAGKDIATAKAQFYPNVNLVAFAGLSSIGLSRLLDADSKQWGVGPAVRLPIFDAGRLRANLRTKTADLDAAVESYNAAVIDAVREVADQLASGGSVTRQQVEQRQAQDAAEAAYDIALQRYQAGLGNYLQVLSAETAVLTQRRLAVDLAARAIEAQTGLARALGGGWQPEGARAAALEPIFATANTP